MKYLAGFALLATAAVLPLFGTDRAPATRCADFAASSIDEPPPPVDCPFCGGDATAHRLRIRKLVYTEAGLLLRVVGSNRLIPRERAD
ncbi:MAG: hypothetical protein HUU28_05210 [Planctomycetaceae bacterium]|nr:hypothetical protein [Planctomycetaceae bacterium]